MTDVYSHPDYQQFLARIRKRPDDDVVRLVCADWLEDRGEGEHTTPTTDSKCYPTDEAAHAALSAALIAWAKSQPAPVAIPV